MRNMCQDYNAVFYEEENKRKWKVYKKETNEDVDVTAVYSDTVHYSLVGNEWLEDTLNNS